MMGFASSTLTMRILSPTLPVGRKLASTLVKSGSSRSRRSCSSSLIVFKGMPAPKRMRSRI